MTSQVYVGLYVEQFHIFFRINPFLTPHLEDSKLGVLTVVTLHVCPTLSWVPRRVIWTTSLNAQQRESALSFTCSKGRGNDWHLRDEVPVGGHSISKNSMNINVVLASSTAFGPNRGTFDRPRRWESTYHFHNATACHQISGRTSLRLCMLHKCLPYHHRCMCFLSWTGGLPVETGLLVTQR